MIKKRFISMLVLLAAVVTGAWAEEETLLTTITPTGDGTYSETTVGAVTVTPTGSFFYSGSSYGWRWDSYGSLTVTANEGYTITRCVFIQQGKNQSVTISEAPFALNFEEWLCLENTSMDGVTSIEVYGTAPAAPAGYAVSLKAETADEGNWTAKAGEGEYQSLPLEGVAQGTQVSLKYNGSKKVKSVKAVKKAPAVTDLSTINANYTASNGETLTGTLANNVKISIADGATVTLAGVTINGVHSDWYLYAGITCLGDATIILKDGTTNTVTGFDGAFPGIQGAAGKTLTITGSGSLYASCDVNGSGAGIGSASYSNYNPERACGNIVIEGGTITAVGGYSGAGIGSGSNASCGNITIKSTVAHVTATKGKGAPDSIGAGQKGSCGTKTIEDASKVTENSQN